MATHQVHKEDDLIYFVTFTCFKWLKLIEITNTYNEVYKWFRKLEDGGSRIVGFVIMPNHVHCLIYVKQGSTSLNKLVANGKRFMAYAIVKKLKELNRTDVLSRLGWGVEDNEIWKGKKHKVFRLSFDAKPCYTDEMIAEVLNYMHLNPVSGKWRLVNDYGEYEHSSARYYETGKDHEHCRLIHFRDDL